LFRESFFSTLLQPACLHANSSSFGL
jgi:hypothetical protein